MTLPKFNQIVILLAVIFGLVSQMSCKKDSDLSGSKQDAFFSLPDPCITEANQLNILSVEETADCVITTQNSTSSPHDRMLMPDPTSPLCAGCIYELNSIIDGGYTEVLQNMGGEVKLIIRSGTFSNSLTVENSRSSILEGITQLRESLPTNHTQDVNIDVKEGFSAKHIAAEAGMAAHGTFFNVVSNLNYSNTEMSNKYSATVVVNDFSIEVEYPGKSKVIEEWFPNATLDQLSAFNKLPVYGKRMDFGKILLFNIESNLSEQEINANLEASFGAFTTVDIDLSFGYHNIAAESNISITTIGGTVDGSINILSGEDGPLLSYLEAVKEDEKAETSQPIFVQLGFVNSGANARVVLATDDYVVRECSPIPPSLPQTVTIDEISLLSFPANKPNGSPWDGTSGPDIFITINTNPICGITDYIFKTDINENLNVINAPFYYSLGGGLTIDINQKVSFCFYDDDGNSSGVDPMGDIRDLIYNGNGIDFPETVTFEHSNGLKFSVDVSYTW